MQSTIRTAVLSILLLAPVLSFAQIPAQPADTLTIEELVFVGFTQQKKVNLTGSISQVDMEAVLGDRPLISLSAAMQGAVPGLTVSGGSSPGQPKNFNIRGTLSLNGG